ncbi:hypothetical protein V8E36_002348, partial [Tilletia maclaganii]
CAMCKLWKRPHNHAAGQCTGPDLNVPAHIGFRKNDWGYGQACFYCNLPQDICGRRNDAKTCFLAPYRDAVRGVSMMLTSYPDAFDAAVEVAGYINPDYTLERSPGPLQMGDAWRKLVHFWNGPIYRAFLAVAAVLL